MQQKLFNYYLLAVQTWCTSLNIHGLWANLDAKHYPSNCTDNFKFSESVLNENQTLVTLMNKYWNTSCSENNLILYEHEYNKHGSCISEQTGMTQNEFFGKAIELFLSSNSTESTCYDLKFTKIPCPSDNKKEIA